MQLNNASVIVVGGSRGLGLAAVESLVAQGARVTVVARDLARLAALGQRLAITTHVADMTDASTPLEIIEHAKPEAIVFVAGATPAMVPIATVSWEDFSVNWNADTRGLLYWIQGALAAPLRAGSRFLTVSSGAAIGGSPLSGGYAGAKRMQWLMMNYAQAFAQQARLELSFQTFIPHQMIGGTATGDAGSRAYAAKLGITPEAFLARFGKSLNASDVGNAIVRVLSDPQFEQSRTLRINGDEGLTVLEPAAA